MKIIDVHTHLGKVMHKHPALTIEDLLRFMDRQTGNWSSTWCASANGAPARSENRTTTDMAKGSKYYPRGVTAILWLEETPESPNT